MITFAPTVLKEQIIIVEMGDDRFEELIDKKILREFIENKANNQSKQYYNFIDEMQMVKYFEGTIISLIWTKPQNNAELLTINQKLEGKPLPAFGILEPIPFQIICR